jgi:23S rRNA pseudouridine1911/1915/1917 synthase
MLNFSVNKKERLDKLLSEQIPEVSRSRIQKAIKEGLVLVNGQKVIETDFKLTPDDKIELPEFEINNLQPSTYDLKIIYENEDLAVIDKPAGLMVHPAAGRDDVTLASALLGRFPEVKDVGDPHRPGIVHRLDEDTSGLLLITKTQEAFDYYKNLFMSREIEKEYLALVHGVPEKLHGIIDIPIGKTSTHQKMSVQDTSLPDRQAGASGGKVTNYKEAKTEYKLLQSDNSGQFSLLQVKLHTGRTHQIRVHLSHIGHPVVGDKLYGKRPARHASQLVVVMGRQFLHAYRLKFRLMDGTFIELFSELPKDLKQILNKLNIEYHATSFN